MKKVVVLLGGCGSEREVSLNSARATIIALKELGALVVELDLPSELEKFISQIKEIKPDVVFNCLHGDVGENGTIQGILNYLKVPYTHSGMLASAMAMDKWQTYKTFMANDIPTPKTILHKLADPECPIAFPCMVKPIDHGSSVGMSFVNSNAEWQKVRDIWQFGDRCIVQEYLKCREIHVAVLNNEALGTIEVRHGYELFTYHAKYNASEFEAICPAPISESEANLAKATALSAYQVLGCRGLARIDMLFDGSKFIVLELNTQPGFTSNSLAPKIAQSQGISFKELVNLMLVSARCD